MAAYFLHALSECNRFKRRAASERVAAQAAQRRGQNNAFKQIAGVKGIFAYSFDAAHCHRSKRRAFVKGFVADFFETVGQNNAFECGAIVKRALSESGQIFAQRNRNKRRTAGKRLFSYVENGRRDGKRTERRAVCKRIVRQRFQPRGLSEAHFDEVSAAVKGIGSDFFHVIGNFRHHNSAFVKRGASDFFHFERNVYLLQARTFVKGVVAYFKEIARQYVHVHPRKRRTLVKRAVAYVFYAVGHRHSA